ncbi:Hypothetical protein NocV09_01600860 [Nannochloropsis oceanica]
MVRLVSNAGSTSSLVTNTPSVLLPPPKPLTKDGLLALNAKPVTLIGFGSLLSETSSRMTFPQLVNFRLGRVQGYRRLFRHPAAIFFERGIALPASKEYSSLSVEPVEGDDSSSSGFVCSLFDVLDFNVQNFVDREEEFAFTMAQYMELEGEKRVGQGLMCLATTDAHVEERWGEGYIKRKYGVHGLNSIWELDSTILPCPVYLRHCVLSAGKKGGKEGLAYQSFVKETFLADRKTTIEEHLIRRPDIMLMEPPASVLGRYSG